MIRTSRFTPIFDGDRVAHLAVFLFCLSSFSVLLPKLPVYLDCPLLIVLSVFFNDYLDNRLTMLIVTIDTKT